MNNGNSIRTNVLPAKGNQTLFPGAEAIYGAPSSYGAQDSIVLVEPGRFVVIDEATGVSIAAGATPATNPIINIGVGVDDNKDGTSDYIRWSGPIAGCSLLENSAYPSTCGLPSVVDLAFGCVECGKTYTVEVVYKSNITDAHSHPNRGYIYTFSYTPPCPGCDGCDTTISCDQVMCGLYNTVNKLEGGTWNVVLNGEPVPADHEYPFQVAKLFDADGTGTQPTTYLYTLTPVASAELCGECINYPDIGGFTVGTGEELVTTTFDPATWITESAVKYSRKEHLKRIKNLITLGLDGSGTATLVECVGACGSTFLEVNTCILDFVLLDGDGVAIVPTATSAPFANVEVFNECHDCDNPEATTRYACGLRFFGNSAEYECDCFAGNKTKATYLTELEVYPKFGFEESGGAIVTIRQRPSEPTNQGFQLELLEVNTLREGHGEIFSRNLRGGRNWIPEDRDLINHILTQCDKAYCVIWEKHYINTKAAPTWGGGVFRPIVWNFYLIPQSDTATVTAFEAFWNQYWNSSVCPAVTPIACLGE